MKINLPNYQFRLVVFLIALFILMGGAFIGYAIEGYFLAIIIEIALLAGILLLKSLLMPPMKGTSWLLQA